MGANYFGHVYLAENLMDLMKRRGGGRRFSRVVFVSSKLSLTAKLDPWNFDLNMNGQAYHVERQYARAKLAQAMYVCHLAKRMEGSGIAAVALCTGTYLSIVLILCRVPFIPYGMPAKFHPPVNYYPSTRLLIIQKKKFNQ